MEVERSGEFAVHSEKEIIRTQTSEKGRVKNKVQEKEEERVGGKKIIADFNSWFRGIKWGERYTREKRVQVRTWMLYMLQSYYYTRAALPHCHVNSCGCWSGSSLLSYNLMHNSWWQWYRVMLVRVWLCAALLCLWAGYSPFTGQPSRFTYARAQIQVHDRTHGCLICDELYQPSTQSRSHKSIDL